MLDCRPNNIAMDPTAKLIPGQGEPLKNSGRYWRLVGRRNYLIVPDIIFVVSMVSQFLNATCDSHWDVVMCILQYIKIAPGYGLLYEDKDNTIIIYYFDADWAGSLSDIWFHFWISCSYWRKYDLLAKQEIEYSGYIQCQSWITLWQQLHVRLQGLGNFSNS